MPDSSNLSDPGKMRRLFNAYVQLVYEDKLGETSVSSSVADRTEFWWNERKPDEPTLWESKIYLGEAFFNEIINHPVPLDMNTLTALKRCSLGLDLYLWLTYRTFTLRAPMRLFRVGVPHFAAQIGQGPSVQRRPQPLATHRMVGHTARIFRCDFPRRLVAFLRAHHATPGA